MKYFIGKKLNNNNLTGKKNKLEEIMLEIGVEKEVNETEILSKIKEEICRNKISIKRDKSYKIKWQVKLHVWRVWNVYLNQSRVRGHVVI